MSGWQGSDRKQRLPSDWPALRRACLERDGYTCRIQGPTCVTVATDADHVRRGDDHRLTNLQAVCGPCHRAKTTAEAHAARAVKRIDARMPVEKHPGLL